LKLYTLYQNSAGERVRIALNLKGVAYDYVSIASLEPGAYRTINPQGLMPALEVDGRIIVQSGAMLEFIEERWPEPSLFPSDSVLRAQARAFGNHVAAELHAVTVGRVRNYLGTAYGADKDGILHWVHHWLAMGFTALEQHLTDREEPWPFCFGNEPGWADLHVLPQMANARRHGLDLEPWPLLRGVEARCVELDAFRRARPDQQPDYPASD